MDGNGGRGGKPLEQGYDPCELRLWPRETQEPPQPNVDEESNGGADGDDDGVDVYDDDDPMDGNVDGDDDDDDDDDDDVGDGEAIDVDEDEDDDDGDEDSLGGDNVAVGVYDNVNGDDDLEDGDYVDGDDDNDLDDYLNFVDFDTDTDDDDVIILSPRAFEQALQAPCSRPNQAPRVESEDSELAALRWSNEIIRQQERLMVSHASYMNLEGSSTSMPAPVAPPPPPPSPPSPPPPPPPPPPSQPAFNCSICMGPFTDAMTTKCGHIFCEECIKTAYSVQQKCPTCRNKIKFRELHRVYLPF